MTPGKFKVALTLADVNLIANALGRLGEREANLCDSAKALRLKIDRRVEEQLMREKRQKEKQKAKKRLSSPPSRDAMSKRLPGSYGSAQR
jgi:hypothetical protein